MQLFNYLCSSIIHSLLFIFISSSTLCKMLPDKILSMFEKCYCRYELKGIYLFKKLKVRTNTRCRTISVRGVNLWNCLHIDLKLTQTISGFKRLLRNKMILSYR